MLRFHGLSPDAPPPGVHQLLLVRKQGRRGFANFEAVRAEASQARIASRARRIELQRAMEEAAAEEESALVSVSNRLSGIIA